MYQDLKYKTIAAPFAKPQDHIVEVTPQEYNQRLNDQLLKRAIDTDGYTDSQILAYAKLYANLAYADQEDTSEISIKKVDNFFNGFIKEDNRRVYKDIRKLLGFLPFSFVNIKQQSRAEDEVMDYLTSIHTIENLLTYSVSYRHFFANVVAPKFADSNRFSLVELVKLSTLWFFFLSKKDYTPFDYTVKGTLQTSEKRASVSRYLVFPESLLRGKWFFTQLEDGLLSLQKIKSFLNSCNANLLSKFDTLVQLNKNVAFFAMHIYELNTIKLAFPKFEVQDFYYEENRSLTDDTYRKIIFSIFEDTGIMNGSSLESDLFNEVDEKLVSAIFDRTDEDFLKLAEKYSITLEISAEDFVNRFKTVCNIDYRKAFIKFNPKQLENAVKRAEKKAIQSQTLQDRTILRIYNYLKENDPICGNSKQRFSQYGI